MQKARELPIAKGQTTLTDIEVMQRLVRDHPEVHEYLRCRTMGMPVPRHLVTPIAKRDTTAWQAYDALDFPATQDKLLDAARAEAITKGLVATSDPEVMTAYFASHPEAYEVYRYKANGGKSVPAPLRGQAVDVRKAAEEIVLFRKVVDDEVERLRRLDKSALERELVVLARESVRKSAELTDCSDAFALDVLFSYREDLYRLWQEKQAA